MVKERGQSTKAVHSGELKGIQGSVNTPVFMTTTFTFPTEDPRTWQGEVPDHTYIYTRYGNPSIRAVEDKVAALEGAERGLMFSSGMATTATMLLGLLSQGEQVVSMEDIYGGTYNLMKNDLSRFGIDVQFVPSIRTEDIAARLSKKTRVLWLESPNNPLLKLVDIHALADAAHDVGALVAVDNTFASPVNQNPIALGADLVMHSCTKYLNGHADVVAGCVVGNEELIGRLWKKRITMGGNIDPMGAFLVERGIKSLSARMRVHNENGMRIASYLEGHPLVERVHYPGLESHPQHELAKRQMKGFGGMVSFTVKGGRRSAEETLKGLKLICMATSLGGVESLASMPLNSSHTAFSPEERRRLGIEDGLIRLSVGIEDAEDIEEDLDQALRSSHFDP
jgi:cystathionine gamma-lyase